MQSAVEVDPLTEFFDAIKSHMTKDRYEKRLDLFLKHMEIEGQSLRGRAAKFASKAKKEPEWATYVIVEWMRFQKERAAKGEIAESTVPNFYKPIKLFCEMNDIILNWKKITRRFPRGRQYGQDRAPSLDEIKQILAYPDRRTKPVLLLMASSGIRIGSFDYLNWKHIVPSRSEEGGLVAAKVTVYAGDKEEYVTFTSPEAFHALEEYMKYRASQGEKVGPDSPVIRDLFQPDRGGLGEPHIPKRLKSTGVKRLISDALKATSFWKPLKKGGKRRHEFQAAHGFRKFFKTVLERHMKTLHAEILLGHNVGLNENYYRVPEKELLHDYLKAVPDLTILEQPTVQPGIQDVREKIEELAKENKQLQDRIAHLEELIMSIKGEPEEAAPLEDLDPDSVHQILKESLPPEMGGGGKTKPAKTAQKYTEEV